MTVNEALTKRGITPDPSYNGIEMADDFVLAIQTETTQEDVNDWIVCQDHVRSHTGTLNAQTEDSTYIRTGTSTLKASAQRTISVQGDRFPGDPFQDFVLSHDILYGTGQDCIVPYVYFSLRTGKGEKGQASLVVTADAEGEAGKKATFTVSMPAVSTPDEYTYAAPVAG